jgi:hypothetical protein
MACMKLNHFVCIERSNSTLKIQQSTENRWGGVINYQHDMNMDMKTYLQMYFNKI